MLRVIDEDADSFAARAEMYYKKRPELIAMVEEFYRSHRSLAERYDLLRPSSVHKHGSDSESHEKSSTCDESSWSEACETHEEYAESEIDNGESKWVDESEIDGIVEEIEPSEVVYSEAIQMLKEENSELKKRVTNTVVARRNKEGGDSQRKQQMWKPFEFKKIKLEGLWGKGFGNWALPNTDSTSKELMSL
ncbi:unnamed protein product [Arabidopsis thaliana]|uniref:(thale cress) hypothetical protein n=1 Tax=Arabidopsis thaliana TaxID=3702 RepID=A0A7G2DNB1_ARATH|nr:unnamed protein product [Arabidopsis thaliana]